MNLEDIKENFEAQHDVLQKLMKIHREIMFLLTFKIVVFLVIFVSIWIIDKMTTLFIVGAVMFLFQWLSQMHYKKLIKIRDSYYEELTELEQKFIPK